MLWVLVISVLTITPVTARDVSMNGIFLSKKLHRFAEDIMGLPIMQVYVLAANTPYSRIYSKSTLHVDSYIVAFRFRSFGQFT